MSKDNIRRRPTVSDVARKAGVAPMTVSRVVNEDSGVSESTRSRVQVAIRTLGYQVNEAARALKGYRSHLIGMIIPTLVDTFFSECAASVQELVSRHGYLTIIHVSPSRVDAVADDIDMMVSHNVAGLIIIPTSQQASPQLTEANASGLPIVVLDRVVRGLNVSEVLVENSLGAEAATRHLIWHGHKQIVCLGCDTDVFSIRERIRGYNDAMKRSGLQPHIWKEHSVQALSSLLRKRLEASQRPTALFTLNNVATMQTLRTLQDMDLRIPNDIALVGFDDLELYSLLPVPVTVVHRSARELGTCSAQLLLDVIQGLASGKRMPKMRLSFPTYLIIRASCGCKTG